MENVIENCLKAINKSSNLKNLNMFITVTQELALKQAQQSHSRIINKKKPLSKIDGLIFSVKDNFSTESILTTCGSKMLENYKPLFNATVVERLFNSGSILIGKTNLDEFGMGTVSSSHFGTVKNPFNIIRNKEVTNTDSNDFYVSGGSSGGSAASVASGIAAFSIGSDTGGSIRNPASICGVIGFKPTYGLISRYGLIPLNNYFDTVGILSRDINVLVDVLNMTAGPDKKDATMLKTEFKSIKLNENFDPGKIRIGVPKEFYPNGLSTDNLAVWNEALKVFSRHSKVKIVPISLPNAPYTMSCYSVLTSCEVASNFARYDGLKYGYHTKVDLKNKEEYDLKKILTKTRNESLGNIVKSRIVSGNYFLLKSNYEKYFLNAHKIKQMIVMDFQKIFDTSSSQKVDLIVTPTCFHDTITYGEYLKQEQVFDERDFFTAIANISGLPAITVPVRLSSKNRMPIGIQFITEWKQDEHLLNIANWFIKNNIGKYPYFEELF